MRRIAAIVIVMAFAGCSDPGCPSGFVDLGVGCIDMLTDRDNCGAAENACGPGFVCENGTCMLACPEGMTECEGVCRDLVTDIYNCGMCGLTCASGNVCVDGACTPDCPDGYTDCGGTCKNLQNDPSNCGDCGNACAAGEVCLTGGCSFTCPEPYTDCSGSCADLSTDHTNCGACGTTCLSGQICDGGSCVPSCLAGLTLCSGACVDLMRDRENCGSCAARCADGELCFDGTCTTSCPGGFTNCSDVCRDLNTDRLNCGACETECADGEVCVSGACEVTCASPYTACSGACVDLSNDPRNCGTCGTICPDREACVSGTCRPHEGAIGHAVMIGHDYFASNASADAVVGNAALLANTTGTINILGWSQYADTTSTGEVANTNAAITAHASSRGRTVSITTLSDYTTLSTAIVGQHVLVIYEMERGTSGMGTTVGTAWATTLATFMANGGVVIACNYFDESWAVMSSSGLLDITAVTSIYGSSVEIADTTHPIAAGVASPYPAPNGSASYTTTETGIVARVAGGGAPVVIHRIH